MDDSLGYTYQQSSDGVINEDPFLDFQDTNEQGNPTHHLASNLPSQAYYPVSPFHRTVDTYSHPAAVHQTVSNLHTPNYNPAPNLSSDSFWPYCPIETAIDFSSSSGQSSQQSYYPFSNYQVETAPNNTPFLALSTANSASNSARVASAPTMITHDTNSPPPVTNKQSESKQMNRKRRTRTSCRKLNPVNDLEPPIVDKRFNATKCHRQPSEATTSPSTRSSQRNAHPCAPAIAACQLWLATHPGVSPSEHVISGLSIAFDASFDSLRRWFRSQPQDEDSGYHTVDMTENDITAPYEVNQNKCKSKATACTTTTPLCASRGEGKPFVCTSRCGKSFKNKDDWRRHEENNFPQRLWHCPVQSCRQSISFRKEHFQKHLVKQHNWERVTDQDCKANCLPVNSQFDKRCIYRACNTQFRNWKDRTDHIAKHLAEPGAELDWRSPQDDVESDSNDHALEDMDIDRSHSDDSDGDESSDEAESDSDSSDDEGNDPGSQDASGSGSGPGSGTGPGPEPSNDRGSSDYSPPGCFTSEGKQGGHMASYDHSFMYTFNKQRSICLQRDVSICNVETKTPSTASNVLYSNSYNNFIPEITKEADFVQYIGTPQRSVAIGLSHLCLCFLRWLGQGATSKVDEVKDRCATTTMARKVIKYGTTASHCDRLEAEILIMHRMRHPHIVRLVNAFSDFNSCTILMEPAADFTLSHYLRSGSTPLSAPAENDSWTWFNCLASGLSYMHSHDVTHGDIKPANILIKNNHIFYADFGLANLKSVTTSPDPAYTTHQYAAPEIQYGQREQPYDVWSLGCVFLEVMTFLLGHGMGNRYSNWNRVLRHMINDHSRIESAYCNNPDLVSMWCLFLLRSAKGCSRSSLANNVLKFSARMMEHDPNRRPTAAELAKQFTPLPCCVSNTLVPDLLVDKQSNPQMQMQTQDFKQSLGLGKREPIPPTTIRQLAKTGTTQRMGSSGRGSLLIDYSSSEMSLSTIRLVSSVKEGRWSISSVEAIKLGTCTTGCGKSTLVKYLSDAECINKPPKYMAKEDEQFTRRLSSQPTTTSGDWRAYDDILVAAYVKIVSLETHHYDDSVARYEGESEQLNSHQVRWDKIIKRRKYKMSSLSTAVNILLLSWDEYFDDTHVKMEVDKLAKVFNKTFRYRLHYVRLGVEAERAAPIQGGLGAVDGSYESAYESFPYSYARSQCSVVASGAAIDIQSEVDTVAWYSMRHWAIGLDAMPDYIAVFDRPPIPATPSYTFPLRMARSLWKVTSGPSEGSSLSNLPPLAIQKPTGRGPEDSFLRGCRQGSRKQTRRCSRTDTWNWSPSCCAHCQCWKGFRSWKTLGYREYLPGQIVYPTFTGFWAVAYSSLATGGLLFAVICGLLSWLGLELTTACHILVGAQPKQRPKTCGTLGICVRLLPIFFLVIPMVLFQSTLFPIPECLRKLPSIWTLKGTCPKTGYKETLYLLPSFDTYTTPVCELNESLPLSLFHSPADSTHVTDGKPLALENLQSSVFHVAVDLSWWSSCPFPACAIGLTNTNSGLVQSMSASTADGSSNELEFLDSSDCDFSQYLDKITDLAHVKEQVKYAESRQRLTSGAGFCLAFTRSSMCTRLGCVGPSNMGLFGRLRPSDVRSTSGVCTSWHFLSTDKAFCLRTRFS